VESRDLAPPPAWRSAGAAFWTADSWRAFPDRSPQYCARRPLPHRATPRRGGKRGLATTRREFASAYGTVSIRHRPELVHRTQTTDERDEAV